MVKLDKYDMKNKFWLLWVARTLKKFKFRLHEVFVTFCDSNEIYTTKIAKNN